MKYSCFSVANLCLTLCDTKDCCMPGLPVLHCLLEFAQTNIHCVDDAIQPSQTLFPPSPLALNLSQDQGLFQWVGSLHQETKVMELQLQHQSSNENSALSSFRIDWLVLLADQGTLKKSSLALQFKSINSSALSLPYGSTLTSIHELLEKP